ncbi:MAG: hypothetical protein AB2556_23575 [Candidatus Thiodiazotropha sp.]
MEVWKPGELILTSRQKVRDLAQRLLFERHEKHFPDVPVHLLYRPKDTRLQNIMVTIPGPLVLDGRPDQQELVLNGVVEVPLQNACEVPTANGARAGLLAMPSRSTQAKVSPSQTPKKSGLSMTSCSGPTSHIWLFQGWSTCTSP